MLISFFKAVGNVYKYAIYACLGAAVMYFSHLTFGETTTSYSQGIELIFTIIQTVLVAFWYLIMLPIYSLIWDIFMFAISDVSNSDNLVKILFCVFVIQIPLIVFSFLSAIALAFYTIAIVFVLPFVALHSRETAQEFITEIKPMNLLKRMFTEGFDNVHFFYLNSSNPELRIMAQNEDLAQRIASKTRTRYPY